MKKQTILEFQSHIRKWRAMNRRDLPWRRTRDPYKIWISETMLCQTQVKRVLVYYKRRLEEFPDLVSLANASKSQILTARSGLGYNSRGLRVLQTAQMLVADGYIDTFPDTYKELIALPGVGDYVASAILAFSYHRDVAVIDTNIRRILIYHFNIDPKTKLKDLKALALDILPRGYASDRYNALMDYGALELTSKKTGIRPVSRQSKFEGSRRQVRAWIIKQLVQKKSLGRKDIISRFPDRDDYESIISDLIKEEIIQEKDNIFSIKN